MKFLTILSSAKTWNRTAFPIYNALTEKYERRHAKLSGLGNLFLFS